MLKKLFFDVQRRPEGPILLFTLLVQFVCIGVALAIPEDFRYLSTINLAVLIKSVAPLGIMVCGVAVLMVAGEFDLSVGALYSMCAIIAAMLAKDVGDSTGMSAFLAALIAVAIGAAASMTVGAISLGFGIPSFIVSLGAMLIWQGLTLFLHGATSIRFDAEPAFDALFASRIGIASASFLWFAGLVVVFHLILFHHRLGNHIFAVGGNANAATAIGIKRNRTKLIAFGIAGGCAAFAGIIAMARVGSVQPGGGIGLELQAIAGAVIGGVALTGGRGSVIGAALGTLLVYTVQDVLLLLRAPGFYFDGFVGVLIIASVIANKMLSSKG